MSKLRDDLSALSDALSTLIMASPNDPGLIAALAQVNAALGDAAAMDIIAALPSDADGETIKAMLAKMGKAADAINAEVGGVTNAIKIATGFASIVKDVGANNIIGAAQTALKLGKLVH